MSTHPKTRRDFLASTVVFSAGAAAFGPSAVQATPGTPSGFAYEITRTDAQWRALLDDDEYHILREGGTEFQRTSPFWNCREAGTYCCKGCDLPLYSSATKVNLSLGWVFFRHSEPNAILTDIDVINPYGNDMAIPDGAGSVAMMEVHCRRCGSHLGHLVSLQNGPMHCINGTALTFFAA